MTEAGRRFVSGDSFAAPAAVSGVYSVATPMSPPPAPPFWTAAPTAPGGSILYDGVADYWAWDCSNFFFWWRPAASALPAVPPRWVPAPFAPEQQLLLCCGNLWWFDRTTGSFFVWSRAS